MSKDIQLSPHEEKGNQLKTAQIGLFALVSMYYSEVCAGGFGIEEMISESGPGMTLVILMALAIFWAVPISLICAELGSARPDEGGILVWIKEAMGEFWYGIALVCMTDRVQRKVQGYRSPGSHRLRFRPRRHLRSFPPCSPSSGLLRDHLQHRLGRR